MSPNKPALDDLRIERQPQAAAGTRVWLPIMVLFVLMLAVAAA